MLTSSGELLFSMDLKGDWNATLESGELDQEAREQVLAEFDR